jgi:hypothetical protein
VALEPTGAPALWDASALLRDRKTPGPRPAELPDACLPQRLRACVGPNGPANRRAAACAVLTTWRDAIKRGNIWMRGSTRLGVVLENNNGHLTLPSAEERSLFRLSFRQAVLVPFPRVGPVEVRSADGLSVHPSAA